MLEKHTKSEPVSIGQSEGDAHQIGQYQGKYVEQKKNEKNSVTIAKAICLLKLMASIESHTQCIQYSAHSLMEQASIISKMVGRRTM